MVLLGCKPAKRNTEQHDIFFGIAPSLADLKEEMNRFWPDSGGLHIDAWRKVTMVDGYSITAEQGSNAIKEKQLFFVNLGGYLENAFEEFHAKALIAADHKADAIKASKRIPFFKEANLDAPGGASHIDDKYGLDVDEVFQVEDLLTSEAKSRFRLSITRSSLSTADVLHIGYLPFSRL